MSSFKSFTVLGQAQPSHRAAYLQVVSRALVELEGAADSLLVPAAADGAAAWCTPGASIMQVRPPLMFRALAQLQGAAHPLLAPAAAKGAAWRDLMT